MSDQQLTGFLGRKIYQAMNDEDGDLSDTRSELFNRYYGDLYGNERDGYSKFTTREVLEAVEWAMPALMRIFVGSDRVVSFDAVGPDDEAAAAQETDVVNHKILKANGGDGFIAIHDFVKDALMYPTAYVKAWVEEEESSVTRSLTGIDSVGLGMLMEREGIEVLEQDSRTETVPMEVPSPLNPAETMTQITPVELFDIKYRETTTQNVLRIMGVPGEEALVDNDLVTINLDHADFVCHRVRKSYTQLVNEGYDPEELDDVGSYEDYQWNDERTNRLFYEDEDPDAEDEDDDSMRRFWVHECFVQVDYDGTGVAQFRRIVLIGAKVFENEETDYQPLTAMSSILVPHKHNGLSLAQLVSDLQELSTTLTRQLLDNIYKLNVRKKFFSEDALLEDGSTMDAMLNTQSEFIPVRGDATRAVFADQTPSILNEILPVIQHVQQSTSLRSGVAPENNVDPDVLQSTTMGAFMGAMEKAGERVEMIARIMAETGMKQLFRKVRQLCRMHPDIATTIKLRGQWIPVDPQGWQDRTDMTVNVGLGFNSKQTMIGLLQQLLEIQQQAAGSGLADEKNVYNTLKKLVESAGVGAVEQYFKDPSAPDWQPPEPAPDPQMILAQAQAQALGTEQERKNFEAQAKIPLEQQKLQQDGQKSMMDAQKAEADAMMKQQEMQMKADELRLKARELDVREQEAIAGIGNVTADTELKGAQKVKTLADAGKSAAETNKTQVEASDEVREAREVLEDAKESEGTEGGSESGEGQTSPA